MIEINEAASELYCFLMNDDMDLLYASFFVVFGKSAGNYSSLLIVVLIGNDVRHFIISPQSILVPDGVSSVVRTHSHFCDVNFGDIHDVTEVLDECGLVKARRLQISTVDIEGLE